MSTHRGAGGEGRHRRCRRSGAHDLRAKDIGPLVWNYVIKRTTQTSAYTPTLAHARTARRARPHQNCAAASKVFGCAQIVCDAAHLAHGLTVHNILRRCTGGAPGWLSDRSAVRRFGGSAFRHPACKLWPLSPTSAAYSEHIVLRSRFGDDVWPAQQSCGATNSMGTLTHTFRPNYSQAARPLGNTNVSAPLRSVAVTTAINCTA